MRRKRKLLLFFSFLFFVLIVGSATIVWRSLDAQFVRSKIESAILALPNEINISIDNVSIDKHFPFITVNFEDVRLIYRNSLKISSPHVEDKLSVLNLISSYISGKPYYGEVKINEISVHYKRIKNASSGYPKSLPVLPVSLTINRLKITFDGTAITGSISIAYLPDQDENRVLFEGKIDNSTVRIDATYSSFDAKAKINISEIRMGEAKLSKINADINLNDLRYVKADISGEKLSYKRINIIKPSASVNALISKEGLKIKRAYLQSSNGYYLNLSGTIDTKNLKRSNISGHISTSRFQIKPFLGFFGKGIDEYLLDGFVSIDNLSFSGTPNSVKFLKSGTIHATLLHFRINRKDPPFFIKKGIAKINEKTITASGSGSFDNISFDSSYIILHRKKGYPCDMHLKYEGSASEVARLFLEHNILSKNDLRTLGKTHTLSGKFSAITIVKNYRWKPTPYFDFDVIINAEGVSFYNENIPHEFIKAWGRIEIKRITYNGRIKELFVRLSRFKANGLFSSATTKNLKIVIKPHIALYGSFNAELSRDDFNFIETQLTGGKIQLNSGRISLNASLKGKTTDLNFKGRVKTSVTLPQRKESEAVDALFDLNIKPPSIIINSCSVNQQLFAKGAINLKRAAFELRIKANDINIADVNVFLSSIPVKYGTVSGNVYLKGANGKLLYANGAIDLRKGFISDSIRDIDATVSFNKDLVNILNSKLTFNRDPVSLTGVIRLNKSVRFVISAPRLTVDLDNISVSKSTSKYAISLPLIPIFATAKIGTLIIKEKHSKTQITMLFAEFVHNADNTNLRLESRSLRLFFKRSFKRISINLKDRKLFAFLTHYKGKNNTLTLTGNFTSAKPLKIDLLHLNGRCDITIKHGEFRNVSNFLKLINITNIIRIILGKAKVEKHLPYDKIVAHLALKGGVLKTRKNTIAALYGPNLNIFASGMYDIAKNYLDLYAAFTTLKTINKLISKIPIIGWIIGGKEKSFTGINVHIKGIPGGKISVKPVPLKGLSKGFFNILKRTLTLPAHILGVEK